MTEKQAKVTKYTVLQNDITVKFTRLTEPIDY